MKWHANSRKQQVAVVVATALASSPFLGLAQDSAPPKTAADAAASATRLDVSQLPPEVAQGFSRVARYREGTTTLREFLEDGWSTGDAIRGRLGVVAWRSQPDGNVEFFLGGCGNLDDKRLAQLLDMTSDHRELASQAAKPGQTVEWQWPDGFSLRNASGETMHCKKLFHLLFLGSVLKSSRPMPPVR